MPGLLEFNTLNRGKIPNEVHQPLQKLVAPHVDSFDFFMNQALPGCVSVWNGVVVVVVVPQKAMGGGGQGSGVVGLLLPYRSLPS